MSSRRLVQRGKRAAADNGGPSGNPSSSTQQPRLPTYEPPSFVLDPAARRALAELSTNQDSRKYSEHMKQSLSLLSDSVRDVNDAYTESKARLAHFRSRRGGEADGEGEGDDEVGAAGEKRPGELAEEKAVEMLKDEVPQLSEQIERAVRAVIDMQVTLEDRQQALQDAVKQADAESARAAARRRERNNARAAAAAAADDDNEGGEDGDVDRNGNDAMDEDETPEDITGPLLMLEEARHRMDVDYRSKSMFERYSTNNDYAHFKRLWHDAEHGAEGKPLPDASRWFDEAGATGRNGGGGGGGGDDAGEDDDDLVIDQEHVSLHCPLSLQIMRDPYTSRKCKHTFDKQSIREFLGSNRASKQCPQTGCFETVTFSDFQPDQIMLRRIRRAEESQRAADMDYEDEETMASIRMTNTRAIKTERKGKGKERRRAEDEDEDEEMDE